MADSEKNRFSARAARYARVGANVGGVAARYALIDMGVAMMSSSLPRGGLAGTTSRW